MRIIRNYLCIMLALILSMMVCIPIEAEGFNLNYGYTIVESTDLMTVPVYANDLEYTGYVYNGYTYIPIAIFNDMEIEDRVTSVNYDESTKEVDISIISTSLVDGDNLDSTEGNRYLSISPWGPSVKTKVGVREMLKIMPIPCINGSLYVPMSVMREGLLLDFIWDPDEHTVTFTGDFVLWEEESNIYYEVDGEEELDETETDNYSYNGLIVPGEEFYEALSDPRKWSIPVEGRDDMSLDELLNKLDITVEDLQSVNLSDIDWDSYLALLQDEEALRDLLDDYVDEDTVNLIADIVNGIIDTYGSSLFDIVGNIMSNNSSTDTNTDATDTEADSNSGLDLGLDLDGYAIISDYLNSDTIEELLAGILSNSGIEDIGKSIGGSIEEVIGDLTGVYVDDYIANINENIANLFDLNTQQEENVQ